MRARVRVGVTSRRSSGATRSGLIENSSGDSPSSPRPVRFAGLHLQQAIRIDVDGVGFDGGGRGDGAGDDLALGEKALHPGIDQALAELVEVEEAHQKRDEPGQVQDDDAAGQAGRGALRQHAAELLQTRDAAAGDGLVLGYQIDGNRFSLHAIPRQRTRPGARRP